MANKTTQGVHVDKMLSQISVGYSNDMYICDKIFPVVTVEKQSDKYYVFGKERFRQHDDHRAPGTEANEITWAWSDDQYFCEGHALRHRIADEEMQNADDSFNLEADAVELITEGILMNREVAASQLVMSDTSYESDLVQTCDGTTIKKWSSADSDPILDVLKAKEKVHKKSGIRMNTMVMSEPVYNVLSQHPKLKALITGVQTQIVTMELIKLAFGIDNIIVGSALKSTAKNAGQGDVLGYIWGNSVAMLYIPARPGRKTPAFGYEFQWNKGGAGAIQARKWYDQGAQATLVEAERWYSHKVVCKAAGFLFKDAVTPIGG